MSLQPKMKELPDGSREWWFNDRLHREDGPAIEDANGTRTWFLNGPLHREGGPAVEWPDGGRAWYVRGQLHREDGPAIERANGSRAWYIDDRKLTEEEFNTYQFRMWAVEGRLIGKV